ncbi:MAG: hypothetical protein MEQ74_05020 [Paracoccus sp.]|nr:hypothetical protein [Paracoccus sp. (in: a-proteobacteria)]
MLAKYIDLVARQSKDRPSQETPHECLGVYVSGETWVKAKTMLLDHMESQKSLGMARALARDVVKSLRKNPALVKCAGDLLERAEQLAGISVHGNTDPRPRTLHHQSGAKVTGSRKELAAATGLNYSRIRDLLTGRRRIALGWSASEKEAKKGPLNPGKSRRTDKAPEPEFFEAGASDFF